MHKLYVALLLPILCSSTGCTSIFLPTYQETRKFPGNETLEEARQAFEMVAVGEATEDRVRELKFGSPYTDEEIVGHLRMTAVLTQSQGVGDGVFMDPKIRNCITREDASVLCKLLVVRDKREKREGRGNPLLYWSRLKRIDEVSSWSYRMWFILEDNVIIYKQFEPTQNPIRIEQRTRDFGNVIDIGINVP